MNVIELMITKEVYVSKIDDMSRIKKILYIIHINQYIYVNMESC